jgi:hypothetical protein
MIQPPSNEKRISLKFPARWVLGPCFLFILYSSSAQVPISGIVNTYHQVIEVIPAKSCVRVASTTGLAVGEKLMLIQMKGATVSTTNNATFGDTTSLNNAGNYELNAVCSINGDSIYFFKDILNSYTVAGKVQLVGIPEYYDAEVIDTLKAAPWDNSTGTGGVLAISVTHDLTLDAPLYADTAGYRGGAFLLSSGTCSNFAPANGYFYNASNSNPQSGSYKGEGVYDIPIAQTGGRGAPANGGGGGNNHNNGGGGGANLTAGGIGGGNYSTVGCTTTLRGLAAKALSNWNGKKIFFGGGGGAGHANGGLVASWGGGNGGGIIFLQADHIIGNGQKITANGGLGGPALSDGASGGGAGGTIILDVRYGFVGSVTIQANGGDGGTVNQDGTAGRCYGPGGGGSGGVIYFSSNTPAVAITVNAGAAGGETVLGGSCGTPAPPAAGSAGVITQNYSYIKALNPSSFCAGTLPSKLIYFNAISQQQNAWLRWEVGSPFLVEKFTVEKMDVRGQWMTIGQAIANDLESDYDFTDRQTTAGMNVYRLKIVEKSAMYYYSPTRTISFKARDAYMVYPNPASEYIVITGHLSAGSQIQLFDISGKLVKELKTLSSSTILCFVFAKQVAGIYLLRINGINKKLILQ